MMRWREVWNTVTVCHRMTRRSVPAWFYCLAILSLAASGLNLSNDDGTRGWALGLSFVLFLLVQTMSGFRAASLLSRRNRDALLVTPVATASWLEGILLWAHLRVLPLLALAALTPPGLRAPMFLFCCLVVIFASWAQMIMLAYFSQLDAPSGRFAIFNSVALAGPVLVSPFATPVAWTVALCFGLALGTLLLLYLIRWHLELWKTEGLGRILLGVALVYSCFYLATMSVVARL